MADLRLRRGAPELRARGGLSLYSYRHALASWIDPRFGRAVTRRILGHSTRFSVTDQYVHAADEAVREPAMSHAGPTGEVDPGNAPEARIGSPPGYATKRTGR